MIWEIIIGCFIHFAVYWAVDFLLLACSLIRYLIRKSFKNVENIENTIIINGGNDMNVIAFLVTFIVTFSIIFAFLLSSKGQKWMNEYN